MSRFTPAGPMDSPQRDAGDLAFRGVADKGEPDQLAPGVLRALANGDCRDGTARTRAGSETPTSHQAAAGSVIFGSGVFSDPLGLEWLLLATAAGVWRLRDGHTPRLLATPEALAARCLVVQDIGTVFIFRGSALTPWQWDGDAANAFEPVDQIATPPTVPIPNGPDRIGLRPVPLQGRFIVPHSRTQIAVSDIYADTVYDPAFADFNLTGGNDDTLTALFRYNAATILVGNTQSIQLLTGIEPTLTALSLEPINDQIGILAGATVQRLGNDVLWLSDAGVFPLREVEQRRETAPVPLTDPIERTMLRVNWREAAGACAAVWGECYYLAVPLDGATRNNAILPWNAVLGAWQGVHTFPTGVRFDALHLLDWFGRKRLHAVDYATGRVHLLYEGRTDRIGDTYYEVTARPTFRALRFDLPGAKRFRRGRIYYKGWAPTISATLATDGVNETTVLAAALTRDRTKHTVFGRADYAVGNANDDHADPYREDYSVPIETPFDPDDAGIDFDLEQEDSIPFTLPARGRHATLAVTNTTGTLAVTAFVLEADEQEKADRPTP